MLFNVGVNGTGIPSTRSSHVAPASTYGASRVAVTLALPTRVMTGGVVSGIVTSTLMIWTASLRDAATARCVLPPDSNVAMPCAVLSSTPLPCLMLSSAVMLEGLVMSSIWTVPAWNAVTAAYVWPSDSNMAMSRAPSRLTLSAMLPAAVTLEGLVTSSNWTESEYFAATAAYVRPPDSNMAMAVGP